MIKLINLETGDIMECDICQLRDRGMPDGYRAVDDIATDEWADLYSNLLKSR